VELDCLRFQGHPLFGYDAAEREAGQVAEALETFVELLFGVHRRIRGRGDKFG